MSRWPGGYGSRPQSEIRVSLGWWARCSATTCGPKRATRRQDSNSSRSSRSPFGGAAPISRRARICMTAPVFVDTNVFVYQLDTREPEKQSRARAWAEFLWATRRGRLSFQVLGELYVTVTRKLDPGLDRDLARKMVGALCAWQPVPIDERAFTVACAVQDQFGLSSWHAL